MARINPFRPSGIAFSTLFRGRDEELERIRISLSQAEHANPVHLTILGERGIGKSSLLLRAQRLAEQGSATDSPFLVVHIELAPTATYVEILRKIASELRRKLSQEQRLKEIVDRVWGWLQNWEFKGVKYSAKPSNDEAHQLVEELAEALCTTAREIRSSKSGILIIIDEADKPPYQSHLGELCKLLTERLTKLECHHVAIVLAGLPVLVKKLHDSHESAPRVFSMLELRSLSKQEVTEVLAAGLSKAALDNQEEFAIRNAAISRIAYYSEGHPGYVQEFAYAAFEASRDDVIDVQDVQAGEERALRELGLKHFKRVYIDQARGIHQRTVLRAFASLRRDWVDKEMLSSETRLDVSRISKVLSDLKERGVILEDPDAPGTYRLYSRAFGLWLRSEEANNVSVSEGSRPSRPTSSFGKSARVEEEEEGS